MIKGLKIRVFYDNNNIHEQTVRLNFHWCMLVICLPSVIWRQQRLKFLSLPEVTWSNCARSCFVVLFIYMYMCKSMGYSKFISLMSNGTNTSYSRVSVLHYGYQIFGINILCWRHLKKENYITYPFQKWLPDIFMWMLYAWTRQNCCPRSPANRFRSCHTIPSIPLALLSSQ